MVGKEPFGKGRLGPGLKQGREESDAVSNQVGHRRWANMQFENMWVVVGKAYSSGRDIAGPEPEVLPPERQ
jgi:hypothetical protein